MTSRRIQRTAGFTLIELLASVAIILVLISLLVPGLNAARSQAQRVSCLSQVRQMGSAFLLYAGDNNQMGPYDGRDIGNEYASLWRYNGTKVMFGLLLPYIEATDTIAKTPAVFICPGASRGFRAKLLNSGDNTSYWMNPDVTSNSTVTNSLASIPGSRVAIVDSCAWWQPGLYSSDYDNHAASGINVFRMNGSASWIPIAQTVGLGAWDWNQLDQK